MTTNALPIAIAVIMLYALITGFRRGLIAQIGQLAGLVIGLLASRALTPSIYTMLVDDAADGSSAAGLVICYILVFLAGYFAVIMVSRLLRTVVKAASLSALDRIGGALFKALKWLLIISFAFNLYVAFRPQDKPDGSDWVTEVAYKAAPIVLGMWTDTQNIQLPDNVIHSK